MKYSYVALFDAEDHGFNVTFVDSQDWYTCGDSIPDAVKMATDLLNMVLTELEDEGKPIPEPTPIDQVEPDDDKLIRLIHADTDAYRQLLKEIDGNPIRYAREQMGMSIKEMSDYLDAPYRTVQDWNSGLKRPPKWCERLIFDKIMELKD